MFIISIATVVLTVIIAFAISFKRYNRIANVAFSVSLLATAAVMFGDSMSFFHPGLMLGWKRTVFICEAIMSISWLLFSLSFARSDYWHYVSKFSKVMLYLSPLIFALLILMPIEDFFYSPEFESEKILFLGNAGYFFNILLLLYSTVSLINLEATLRSSSGTKRWEVKYTILGIGGILSINIFYYSHALLYRSINMYLVPVRTGIILISLLLIGFSLLRHRAMDISLTVSRKVLYRSFSLIVVGGYLLGLGLIGEGMRYFGPAVGENIATFLGFLGALLVLSIILSEQLRRKAIVFINKNFYSQKYEYREQWLQFTQMISLKHSFDDLINSIAEGFKNAIGVRGASVWLKENDSGDYFCACALDTVLTDMKPDSALVDYCSDRKWVIYVNDVKCKDIVSRCNEFIIKTRAALIVPLLNLDDLIGFIILEEGLADNEYNYEDYDLLKTLARQSTAAILNARLSEELTASKEMEAMGRLSSFILHDLKNATSMLALIVQNADEHMDNPEFQRDAIRAISNTSEKMKHIIGKLNNLPRKRSLMFEHGDLGANVRMAIHQLNMSESENLTYTELEPVATSFDKEEITKLIVNLIINAFDAAGDQGKISIVIGREHNMGYIKVSDNGCGMSEKFMEKHLFKPFSTTKKKGLGIGLYQCKTIVESHGGKIKVISHKNKGTDFIIYLPLTEH